MSDPRVLVVDDEPQILRFLQPALEASGYAVLHAGNRARGAAGWPPMQRPTSSSSTSACPIWTARMS